MQLNKFHKVILGLLLFSAAHAIATAETLRLSTTTSMKGSGLSDVLIPLFTKNTGIDVKLSVAGTGQVLRLGREGKADLLWVHAPASEQKYIDDGRSTPGANQKNDVEADLTPAWVRNWNKRKGKR